MDLMPDLSSSNASFSPSPVAPSSGSGKGALDDMLDFGSSSSSAAIQQPGIGSESISPQSVSPPLSNYPPNGYPSQSPTPPMYGVPQTPTLSAYQSSMHAQNASARDLMASVQNL